MSVWVQSRSGNEEAIMVDFKEGMNFDQLKEAITLKRDARHLPAGAIESIYSENNDEDISRNDPEDIVPKPEKGKIGASSKMPYFFSIAQTQAVGANRMEKIIASLKKCKINTANASVTSILQRLARNDRNLEVGSVNTDLALSTYENVKEAAGTETKSCIGAEIGMKVNGSVFDEFPFILSAHDSTGTAKLVKILRVPEGATHLSIRQHDVRYEAESAKFVHDAIVPMETKTLNIDTQLATKANCRVGINEVLIMPWYTSTLNKHPSGCLDWIAIQGRRILEALKYLHSHPDGGYAHMDVKAMNVFVDHANRCFLGDFGSCKPLGEPITSCSIAFCWRDVRGQEAHPKYDYFMFLLMVLIECLEDRRSYTAIFYEEGAQYASITKVIDVTQDRIALDTTPSALADLLAEVLEKVMEFQLV